LVIHRSPAECVPRTHVVVFPLGDVIVWTDHRAVNNQDLVDRSFFPTGAHE